MHEAGRASGVVLFELPDAGTGIAIYNAWQDPEGLHFFLWTRRWALPTSGAGFWYTFSPDGKAIRRGFDHGTYDLSTSGGVTKPVGRGGALLPPPAAVCGLAPPG